MNKILLSVVCLGVLACNKPEEVLEEPKAEAVMSFSVLPQDMNGVAIMLNEPYPVNDSVDLKISDFAFYLTELSVKNESGEWIEVRDAWLMSTYDNQTQFQIKHQALAGAKQMRFNIGVPELINHADPASHPNSSPYSLNGSKGMSWGWETGYKFLVIDGKAKLAGSDAFNHNVSLHAGTDNLLRTVEVDISSYNFSDPKPPKVIMLVDLSHTFSNIDLSIESQSHTGSDLVTVTKLMDNFVESFEFVVVQE